MEKLLLGIDMGTTSVKASLYTPDHQLIASGCRDYALMTPEKDHVEFPPEMYWDILCDLTRELVCKAKTDERRVAAVALSCQGETLICLDEHGKPLRPAIVWLDNRAEAEATELKQHFGRRSVYEISGQADMVATWPAAKLLWLRRHQPMIFDGTAKFMLLADYLLYRMTGRFLGEPNLWASSAMLNIHDGRWWQEMLAYIRLEENKLPRIIPSASPAGMMLPNAAEEMGLHTDCLAVTGALDQTCGMIGCGVTRPGHVLETTGSCLAVSAVLDHFVPFDPAFPLTCQNTAVPGQYTVLLWSQSAGMTLKWFAEKFYAEFSDLGTAYSRINKDVEAIQPGCNGLVMLPHLTGAANPEFDSMATGVFAGIRLEHGRAHFARAVMEAVACMLKRNLDQLARLGINIDDVYCAGGGASSPVWLQIKADLTGRNMSPLAARDSACHGAAILAGIGAQLIESVHWGEPTKADGTLRPNAEKAQAYADTYHSYLRLYEALKPYFAFKCNGEENK